LRGVRAGRTRRPGRGLRARDRRPPARPLRLGRAEDVPARLPSALRADELVQTRDRCLAIDRDLLDARPRAMDARRLTSIAKEFEYVLGPVRERVAWCSSHVRAFPFGSDDARPVAVNEAAEERLDAPRHDLALPVSQNDAPLVFPAGPVLGDQAGPVLPVLRTLGLRDCRVGAGFQRYPVQSLR